VLPQALEKMGNVTHYANKTWVACSDNKTVLIITKNTLCVYMNERMRSLIHKDTVNTVYTEYISVVTQSQSHSHISVSGYFSSVVGTYSTAST